MPAPDAQRASPHDDRPTPTPGPVPKMRCTMPTPDVQRIFPHNKSPIRRRPNRVDAAPREINNGFAARRSSRCTLFRQCDISAGLPRDSDRTNAIRHATNGALHAQTVASDEIGRAPSRISDLPSPARNRPVDVCHPSTTFRSLTSSPRFSTASGPSVRSSTERNRRATSRCRQCGASSAGSSPMLPRRRPTKAH